MSEMLCIVTVTITPRFLPSWIAQVRCSNDDTRTHAAANRGDALLVL